MRVNYSLQLKLSSLTDYATDWLISITCFSDCKWQFLKPTSLSSLIADRAIHVNKLQIIKLWVNKSGSGMAYRITNPINCQPFQLYRSEYGNIDLVSSEFFSL